MEEDLKLFKVEYLSNQVKLRELNQNHKCLKGRWAPVDEDPKVLKVEYLSNPGSDFPPIWDLSSGDQIKIKNAWNEDDLKSKTTPNGRPSQLLIEYLSNPWLDLPQILNLCSGDLTKFFF